MVCGAHIKLDLKMLHKGRLPAAAERARLADLVSGYFMEEPQSGCSADKREWASHMRVHTQLLKSAHCCSGRLSAHFG